MYAIDIHTAYMRLWNVAVSAADRAVEGLELADGWITARVFLPSRRPRSEDRAES